jgi:hypothetical protein
VHIGFADEWLPGGYGLVTSSSPPKKVHRVTLIIDSVYRRVAGRFHDRLRWLYVTKNATKIHRKPSEGGILLKTPVGETAIRTGKFLDVDRSRPG